MRLVCSFRAEASPSKLRKNISIPNVVFKHFPAAGALQLVIPILLCYPSFTMSDIDEIKSRLNIVDIIGKSVKLKKTGRNFKGLCPFHNEKTPSFVVSADRQIFHCFGCGKGGTVFDFFMEYHHVDFVEALSDLADLAGVKLTRRGISSPEGTIKEKLYAVNHLASEFYHYILTKHALGEKGLLYLKNRGI